MKTLIAAGTINAGVRTPRRVKCANCGEPGAPGAAFDASQFARKGAEWVCPDCQFRQVAK